MTNQAKQTWSKIGYYAACLLVLIGTGSALAPYLLSPAMHLKLFVPMYGEVYPHEQFPELAKTPINEALHRLGGSFYMIIGLLQFSPRFRKKHWKWHRRLGRVFLFLTIPVGISALVWGITVPFGGFTEAVPTIFFASIFLFSAVKAYIHARKRNIQAHKEWVLRCFHLGIGISSIRIIFFLIDPISPLTDRELLGVTFWLAWSIHLIMAEWWIHVSRSTTKGKAVAA